MSSDELKQEHIAAAQHLWYGHENVPRKSDFEHAWKAVKSVGACDGQLSHAERLHLLGKMVAIGTTRDVIEMVMVFDEHTGTPAELLRGIDVPPEFRSGTGTWSTAAP